MLNNRQINNMGVKNRLSKQYLYSAVWLTPDALLSWHWPVLCTCASVCSLYSNHGMETARHHSHVLSSSLEHSSNGAVLQLEKGIVNMKEGHEGYGVFNAFSTDMVPAPNLESFRTFPLNSKTFLHFRTCSLIVCKH